MKKATLVLVLVLIVILVVFFENGTKSSSETIKIGHVSPLTGDAATYGEPMKNAFQIAVDEVNNSGGIKGRLIEVIYEDSRCDGKEAFNATQKLITIDKVKIITGFVCAEDLMSSASLIEENKILTIAPGASGPEVTNAGDYIFQVNPSATIATKELTGLIKQNYDSVALISENTGFSIQIRDLFVKDFESKEGKVVSSETYNPDTRDFKTLLLKIKETNPEAIFVNPQTEIAGGTIMKQAREIGIDVPFFGLDTVTGEKTMEISQGANEGLTVVAVPGLNSDNIKAQQFLEKYKENFGTPVFDLYLGAAYDSLYLISDAIKSVGDNPEAMKNYLYDLNNYEGVVGNYGFDDNGDLSGIDFVVKKVEGGKLVEVK